MATAPKFNPLENQDTELGPTVGEAAEEFFHGEGGGFERELLLHTIMLQAGGYRVDQAADKLVRYLDQFKANDDSLTVGSVLKSIFGDIQYHIVGLAIYRSSQVYKDKMSLEEAKRIVEQAR
jgi:hypothetical protein